MKKTKHRRKRKKLRTTALSIILILLIAVIGSLLHLFFLQQSPAQPLHRTTGTILLVNANHALPDDYQVELVDLYNGEQVSKEMYPSLQQMFDEMRAQGYDVSVRSGYRSTQQQQIIMDEQIQTYLNQGYDSERASQMAKQWVSVPGYSEHQTGLAVDIDSASHGIEDDYQVYAWLKVNAPSYGFILRYPEGKEDITGITYEPWHYRYVGIPLAQQLTEQNLTLEEYVEQ